VQHVNIVHAGNKESYNEDFNGNAFAYSNEFSDSFVIDKYADKISVSKAKRKGHLVSYSPGCFKLMNPKTKKSTAFRVTPEGLYSCNVPYSGFSLVQTVEENKMLFTPRQGNKAKDTQDLCHMVDRPSYQDFMGIVKNNLPLYNGVTIEDVIHAEQIYDKDLGSIQEKTTRSCSDVVVPDYVMVSTDILLSDFG
jgi:hypothetical protein